MSGSRDPAHVSGSEQGFGREPLHERENDTMCARAILGSLSRDVDWSNSNYEYATNHVQTWR